MTEAGAAAAAPCAPAGQQGDAGWDCHVHVFDAAAPVKGGHYQPGTASTFQVQTLAQQHGVHHLVLVQPSVYGSDNRLLLRALAVEPGRHRGVVVLEPGCTEAELDAMHRAGVRGARMNLVSPVGEAVDAAHVQQRFEWLAPRLQARGWHLQWYATAQHLPLVQRLHSAPNSPVAVLDHLAGLTAQQFEQPSHLNALQALGQCGAWVKLSGWYRLQSCAPHSDLLPGVRHLAATFAARLVWGSDWPHTAFASAQRPSYGSTWAPVEAALGTSAAQALRKATPAIYR